MKRRVLVAVAGSTGLVGQQFVRLLEKHPWFEVHGLFGSARTVGMRYGEAVDWALDGEVPAGIRDLPIRSHLEDCDARIVFSALPSAVAADVERDLAGRGHFVFSNASALRGATGIPLVIPEVNGKELSRLRDQVYAKVGGGIVTNPNCVVAGLALALAPIHRRFGLQSVTVVTMQALSGAGLRGIRTQSCRANVIPYIEGEEAKIQRETCSILNAEFPISVLTNRVSVSFGHSASVFVQLNEHAEATSVERILNEFDVLETVAALPSAPKRTLIVDTRHDRPQPLEDACRGCGMSVSIGKVRSDVKYQAKFPLLVHNTIRGAAGASLLNAELALITGLST